VATEDGPSHVVIEKGQPVAAEIPESQLETVMRLAETDHIALLNLCLDNYRQHYTDYTCTFIKHERINGRFMPKQVVDVAYRQQPYSVAMAWRTTDEDGSGLTMPKGDRALFVEGRWDSQMLVRPTSGLLQALTGGSVRRDPIDPDVMQNTLRPINSFGFERSLVSLLGVYTDAHEAGDLATGTEGTARIDGRDVIILTRALPPVNDYPAARTVIAIDLEYLVPVLVEGYDWQGQKFCTYQFKDIQFNLDLPEERFTPQSLDMNAQ